MSTYSGAEEQPLALVSSLRVLSYAATVWCTTFRLLEAVVSRTVIVIGCCCLVSVVAAPVAELRDVDSASLVMPYGPMLLSSLAITEPCASSPVEEAQMIPIARDGTTGG